jgi:hypothetical protein
MCFSLIPFLGYIGAAVSTAMSELLHFGLNTLLARRVLASIVTRGVEGASSEASGMAAVPVESGPGRGWAGGKSWE